MVQLGVRVVQAQRMLGRGQVVAEHEVELEPALPHTGDRGDRIVRHAVGLGEDGCSFVRIPAPRGQDAVRQFDQALGIGAVQTNDRHRPFDDARLHILEAGEGERGFHRGFFHCKGVAPALEVVMRQNGAAHDRQVGIGADEIMRELAHKVQQLAEARPVDLHGDVFAVKADAVLVIVHIGGVLQKPRGAVDGDRDDAVVLPRGMVDPARVPFVRGAEQALRIVRGGQIARGGDGLGVLFRLGKVDGDIQLAVPGRRLPLDVLGDPVAADIVGILTEFIVPVGGLLRVLGIQRLEPADDLRRARVRPTISSVSNRSR